MELGAVATTKVLAGYDFGRQKQRCNGIWGKRTLSFDIPCTYCVRLPTQNYSPQVKIPTALGPRRARFYSAATEKSIRRQTSWLVHRRERPH